MLASDLIQDLQGLIGEHGDLEVVMADNSTPVIEIDEDDGPAVFVIS